MNVLMDLTHIPLEKTGVGIYAVNLVNSIAELTCNNNVYFILIQDDEHSFDTIKNRNFYFIRVNNKIFRKMIFRFILEQFIIPIIILKNKIDLAHSFHYSFPIISFGAKRVVTIHDMTFFLFPEYHEKIKTYYFRFFTWLSAMLADRIITVSKSTFEDLIRIIKVDKKKIDIIHLGRPKWDGLPVNDKKIEKVKKKYGILGSYLMYMGTIEPRKNIRNLLEGFSEYLSANDSLYQLVICGKKGWKYKEMFGYDSDDSIYENVRFTGFVDEEDKPYLIKGAKIFLYISQYEGFGLPVLEALTLGVPTITSNISSMPEIVGDAGVKINPNDITAIRSSIERLLSDELLYRDLQKLSVEQAFKFDWEKTAKKTLQLYNKYKN